MDTKILIAGLGNPGDKYQKTRHNVGFMVLDALLRDVTPAGTIWTAEKERHILVWKGSIEEREVILALPQTHVNNSGQAIQSLKNYYRLANKDIWIVHDDLDLPLGKLKIRIGGGSAGHRGVESIAKELGADNFVRFRLGIGHPRYMVSLEDSTSVKIEQFVLRPFGPRERHLIRQEIVRVVKALRLSLATDLEVGMRQYNQ